MTAPSAPTARTGSVLGPPRARPAVVGASVLVALALVGVAVVAVHDLVVGQGWAAGTPWLTGLLDAVDGRELGTPVVVGAVVVALLGLWLIVDAVRPGRRTHLRVSSDAELWVSPRAAAATAQHAADRSDGVVSVRTVRSSRRRVVLEVGARDHAAHTAAADAARAALADVPALRLRVRPAAEEADR